MVLVVCKAWTTWSYESMNCGHKGWRQVTKPSMYGEYKDYSKIPNFIKFRASFIKDTETGRIFKNKG